MLFLCSSALINLQRVFKMSAFGTYECFELCTPLVDGMRQLCVVQCCVKRSSS